MEEETGEDTTQAAHKTRQHQGKHEAEATFGGEADLHKHYRGCKKNPGHTNFIPIHDFKIEHLPSECRDNLVLDWIRAEADLTCRLSVRYTSESRPKFHPEHPHLFYPFYQDRGYDWMRVGTGCVSDIDKINEKDGINCQCEECRQPGTQTPQKEWGKISISTARHVVFDSDEARHTTCHFFYDEGSTHISQCPSVTGLRVFAVEVKGDFCTMICASHDMDIIERLDKMFRHTANLKQKLNKKEELIRSRGASYVPDPTVTSGPTIIISHPHGLSKQVTVGRWTCRQILSPPFSKSRHGYEFVNTSYSYNTATCPGSSGAPVIKMTKDRWGWWGWSSYGNSKHTHSEGGDDNDNKSCVFSERVYTGI